jgi:hypothetical protein
MIDIVIGIGYIGFWMWMFIRPHYDLKEAVENRARRVKESNDFHDLGNNND